MCVCPFSNGRICHGRAKTGIEQCLRITHMLITLLNTTRTNLLCLDPRGGICVCALRGWRVLFDDPRHGHQCVNDAVASTYSDQFWGAVTPMRSLDIGCVCCDVLMLLLCRVWCDRC